jgi:hypothetical protein
MKDSEYMARTKFSSQKQVNPSLGGSGRLNATCGEKRTFLLFDPIPSTYFLQNYL